MTSTEKISLLISELDKSADTRHVQIIGDIKAVNKDIGEIKTDVCAIKVQQIEDGKEMVQINATAQAAKEIATGASNKAQDVIKAAAGMAGSGEHCDPVVSTDSVFKRIVTGNGRKLKERAVDVGIGAGGMSAAGAVILVGYLVLKAVLKNYGVDI